MNIVLGPELERLVEQRMKQGRYATPQDVMAAALSALDQEERLGEFGPGELDRLLAEGEKGGDDLDGERVLSELRHLRSRG